MQKLYIYSLALVLGCFSYAAYASNEQERIYLVQLINQLDALKPTILAAAREQPKNQRVTFHYHAWKDANGQSHNGLLEDITLIKQGIEEKLHSTAIEPRTAKPLQGDYFNITPNN